MELRQFTSQDRDTYCSARACTLADNPLIGWSDVGSSVVVDGDYVEIYRDGTGMYPDWALRFPDMGLAILFALDFRGDEPDEIVEIMADRYGRVQQVIE
jgi:hypothetical protein